MASEDSPGARAKFATEAERKTAQAQIIVEASSLLQEAKALAASNKKPQAAMVVAKIRKLLSRLPNDDRDGRNLRSVVEELALRLIEKGPLIEPHKAPIKRDSDLVMGLNDLASYKLKPSILQNQSGNRVKALIQNVLQTLMPFVKKAQAGSTIFEDWIRMWPIFNQQEHLLEAEINRLNDEDRAERHRRGLRGQRGYETWIESGLQTKEWDTTVMEVIRLKQAISRARWTLQKSPYNRTLGGGKFISSRPDSKGKMAVEDRFYFDQPKRFAKTPQSPRTSELLSVMKTLEAAAEEASATLKSARKNKKFKQCADACLSLIANYRRLESVYRDLHASALYFSRARK